MWSSLQTRATEYHLRHQVTDVLDTMVDTGLTVLRTWAFNDGNEWNALQPEPGKYAPTCMLLGARYRAGVGQGKFEHLQPHRVSIVKLSTWLMPKG